MKHENDVHDVNDVIFDDPLFTALHSNPESPILILYCPSNKKPDTKRTQYKSTMGKKVVRDPNAPKRNLSAYLLYQNAMRNTFKSKHPHMTFGQLSKHTSAVSLRVFRCFEWFHVLETIPSIFCAQGRL